MRTTNKKKPVTKPTPTVKHKTVTVPVQEYTLVATQDTTVVGKTKTVGPTRFALLKGTDLVATTGNKKLGETKLNKKTVKQLAPTVLPAVRKLVKAGQINL